jgi:esterase/lipase superfamily enzyme
LGISPEPEDQFFTQVAAKVAASREKQAFVFVHGFDNTFADAARRTAQLAYDLGFDGAPILYSWPSKGKVGSYPADEATVEWTAPHLQKFLEKVAMETHATTVHLIAHSMGNRAVTAAMSAIARDHSGLPPMFKQVFLAAPDIDVGVFRQLARTFPAAAERVTLYASSRDEALVASKRFHSGPRAGDTGTVITIVPKVDTIDATAVDTGLLGHSYYGDNRRFFRTCFMRFTTASRPTNALACNPPKAKI